MERKITKTRFSISVDPELYKKFDHINNKSKFIEWLVYQDILSNGMEGIKDIMI